MGCTGLVHGHERAVSFPQHLACSLQPRQAGPRPARPTQTSMPAPDLRPSHVQRPRSSAQALCPWSSPLATGLPHPVPSGSLPAAGKSPRTTDPGSPADRWPLATGCTMHHSWHPGTMQAQHRDRAPSHRPSLSPALSCYPACTHTARVLVLAGHALVSDQPCSAIPCDPSLQSAARPSLPLTAPRPASQREPSTPCPRHARQSFRACPRCRAREPAPQS